MTKPLAAGRHRHRQFPRSAGGGAGTSRQGARVAVIARGRAAAEVVARSPPAGPGIAVGTDVATATAPPWWRPRSPPTARWTSSSPTPGSRATTSSCDDRGGLGRRPGYQPEGRVPLREGGAAHLPPAPGRADHRHRLDRGPRGERRPGQLCRRQGRPRGPGALGGPGVGLAGDHGERRGPWVHRHGDDPRPPGGDGAGPAIHSAGDPGTWPGWWLPGGRCRRVHHRPVFGVDGG